MSTPTDPTTRRGVAAWRATTTSGGSPRWLVIARDVLLSVMALLVSLAIVWSAVAMNRASNTLEDAFETSTSEPCDPTTDLFCVPGD